MKHTLVVALLLIGVSSRAEDNARRDGNAWRDMSQEGKAYYVNGFFDGMNFGATATRQGLLDQKATACAEVALNSFEYGAKFFHDVNAGQIRDGLDQFYEDYRNRSIAIHRAIWIVVKVIHGTPQKKVNSMVEYERQHVGAT